MSRVVSNKSKNNPQIIDTCALDLSELFNKDKSKAVFYHPKMDKKTKLKISKLVNDDNCFECDFFNAIETTEKIVNRNFQTVYYILDHNQEDVFNSHKKDKLFLAIKEKLGNSLKIIIVKNGEANVQE